MAGCLRDGKWREGLLCRSAQSMAEWHLLEHELQYFYKALTSADRVKKLQAVAITLNNRSRKTLGWRKPVEALVVHLKFCV